jgi:hypothetical protein
MTGSHIYLIEAENGFVKIGRAQKVGDRLQATRTHSPLMTRLIAVWPGGLIDEDALHQRYRSQRHHGEWFEPVGEFADFVSRSRGVGVFDVPDWSELKFVNRDKPETRRAQVVRLRGSDASVSRRPRKPRATRAGMTKRQGEFLIFIREHLAKHGHSPSYQELATEFGLASKSGVHRIVHSLVERGHLRLEPNFARSICLVDRASSSVTAQKAAPSFWEGASA